MLTTELETEFYNLITYMLASASRLYSEPPDYGSFRLLDASARLLQILELTGELDPFLKKLKTELDAERQGSMDPERQRQNIERWVLELAVELRRRQMD